MDKRCISFTLLMTTVHVLNADLQQLTRGLIQTKHTEIRTDYKKYNTGKRPYKCKHPSYLEYHMSI